MTGVGSSWGWRFDFLSAIFLLCNSDLGILFMGACSWCCGLLLGFCIVDVLRGEAAFTAECCLVLGRCAAIDLQKRLRFCVPKKLHHQAARGSTIRSSVRESSFNVVLALP